MEKTNGLIRKYPESFERLYGEIQGHINEVCYGDRTRISGVMGLRNDELNKLTKWSQQMKAKSGIYTRQMREILEEWMGRQKQEKDKKMTLIFPKFERWPERIINAETCDTITQ